MNTNELIISSINDKINIPLTNFKNIEDKHVLIIDDNAINIKVITSLLKLMGYQCLEAYNGRKALQILKEKKIDLILMDVQMHIIECFETTKMIRQTEALNRKHITIVAMTECATIGDKESYLEKGMDDYITKPLYFTKLKELLIKYL